MAGEFRADRVDEARIGSPRSASAVAAPGARAWAWGICWLMFASTTLNYMDRQAISLVGPQVKAQFGLDNVGYGWVMAAFQLTYAFFQWPAGYMVDRWDVRKTYATAVAWWSLAGIATAFAPGLAVLMILRALLGAGESFNWPCALRVTAGMLPPAERSLGNGIFNSGAAIGAVLTPLIVAPLANGMGWRAPFIVLGASGLIWVFAWLTISRRVTLSAFLPPRHQRESGGLSRPAARGLLTLMLGSILIAVGGLRFGLPALWWAVAFLMVGLIVMIRFMPLDWISGSDWALSLAEVVRTRRFWVMAAVGITINVTWHFLVNWMANFFQEERRLGLLLGGMVSALPFLAADIGNLGGGALTSALARRGFTTTTARKTVMSVCLVLVSSAVWVGCFRNSDAMVIALLCLTALGTAAYMVNYFAFGQDVAPQHTGLVIGYLGGLGNLFAAGFMPLAGWISMGAYGHTPNFLIVGLLPLPGLIVLLLGWGLEAEPT